MTGSAVPARRFPALQRTPPVSPTTAAPLPRWREHWLGHDQVLVLAAVSDRVAVYVDRDVPKSAGRRLSSWAEDAWNYVHHTYGDFGTAPLHVVLHADRYLDSHHATYLHASHDHRNVIDCAAGPWRSDDSTVIDLVGRLLGRVVESGNNGVLESPAHALWGAQWSRFFLYDLHVMLGDEHRASLSSEDWARTSARSGSDWWGDWFHPLWTHCGGAAVMDRFFRLLAGQLPLSPDRSYRRFLTWGELVHFTSAAAGGDVSELARRASGWPAGWGRQLEQARHDFPQVC